MNKDQEGKGNVHRTQPPDPPPTHPSRAPRRHHTKVDIRAAKGEGHVM
jgi:hypothetical protein